MERSTGFLFTKQTTSKKGHVKYATTSKKNKFCQIKISNCILLYILLFINIYYKLPASCSQFWKTYSLLSFVLLKVFTSPFSPSCWDVTKTKWPSAQVYFITVSELISESIILSPRRWESWKKWIKKVYFEDF